MPSSVDEQPPGRPPRPRPQPAAAGRRPPARSRAAAPYRRMAPPPPPPGGDDDGPQGRGRPGRPGRRGSQRKTVVIMTTLTVLVAALAVFAISGSRSSGGGPVTVTTTDAATPVTSYHDTLTGFTVEYPRSWQKVPVPVADYRLAVDGGSNVAFTIRVVPIQTPADTSNLENFKAVTDGLVTSNPTVQVLKQQAISLNGMIGYYYFYTFTDGGVQAVHAHYFLFSGHKMNVLVFQALPDDFARLAPTFDKVAESFKVDPETTPTTGVPASTTTTVG